MKKYMVHKIWLGSPEEFSWIRETMDTFQNVEVRREEINKYKDAILKLWQNNLSGGSLDRFEWLYGDSRFGATHTWLSKSLKTNEFIGCCSFLRQQISINGRVFSMGIAIDFALDRKYRVFGPAVSLVRNAVKSMKTIGLDLVIAWPNIAGEGVFSRVGYTRLAGVQKKVKLLKTSYIISRYIKIKPLARVVGLIGDKVLSLLDLLFLSWVRSNVESRIGIVAKNDFGFLLMSGQKGTKICIQKNFSYLSWRYGETINKKYYFFCLIDRPSQSTIGYVVYSYTENNGVNVWDLSVSDLTRLKYLISAFVKEMKTAKINYITIIYLENQVLSKILRSVLFLKRKIERNCYLYVNEDVGCSERRLLLSKENWFLFEGDLDI